MHLGFIRRRKGVALRLRRGTGWRTDAERAADPYDRNFNIVDLYTGFAFAYRLFADGAAEGLYRTITSMLLAHREAAAVLDAGCGVGRVLYDCAPLMPQTEFAAVDFSYNMCQRAEQLLLGSEPVPLKAWERRGRPNVVFEHPRQLHNVAIAQASAEQLPFLPATFDVVMATLLLCRLNDPLRGLAELTRVLRTGGTLLIATPLSFQNAGHWESFFHSTSLRDILASLGLKIDEWFEGLRYREVIDAAGNAHEWNVRIIRATLTV